MYQVGDMDVRSMITMVILNGIDDLDALRSMEEKFSDDLRKSYQCAKKYKGKKVRPEKKKKKKQRAYVAQRLNDLKRLENGKASALADAFRLGGMTVVKIDQGAESGFPSDNSCFDRVSVYWNCIRRVVSRKRI